MLQEPLFKKLAAKYGKTTAQIVLHWHIQTGNVVIPGSKNPKHIRDNIDLFDFELTDEEMKEISIIRLQQTILHSYKEALEGFLRFHQISKHKNKETNSMKNLVIYYSRKGQNYVNGSIKDLKKGNAEVIAENIQKAVDADLFEVDTLKPYSADYTTCTNEAAEEKRNNARPALKKTLKDISMYDNVFIVGPCWWGTYPMPMFTCLEGLDFTGKNVLPA